MASRSIHVIAKDIFANWSKVHFAAKPYLGAMLDLDKITDMYGADSARSVIIYFISNATSFRGVEARRLKAELKAL